MPRDHVSAAMTSKGSKVSKKFRERAQEFNAKIERERMEQEID